MKLKEYRNKKAKEIILNMKGEILKLKEYADDFDYEDDTCEVEMILTDIANELNRIQKYFEESKERDK